jgi:replicative DNA helicase
MKYVLDTALAKAETLSLADCTNIIKIIDDRLTYLDIVNKMPQFIDTLNSIENDGPRAFNDGSKKLFQVANNIMNIKRKNNSLNGGNSFSIADEDSYQQIIAETIESQSSSNRIFRTGISRLNSMLSPGYEGSRLYCYVALPGNFKSGMLLKSAIDIKVYNEPIQTKVPDKIPTVLLIVTENTEQETFQRMFSMITGDSIGNYTTTEAIRQLKRNGFIYDDKHNVNIVIEYDAYRTLSTSDIYDKLIEMKDDGMEVIALIVDYIKRIVPSVPTKDAVEKVELGRILNELKAISVEFDIPVITASQLNRAAATAHEDAMEKGRGDIGKLMRKDQVGSAFEVIETPDWTCALTLEDDQANNKPYLAFRLNKRRSVSPMEDPFKYSTYFVHPLNEKMKIQLLDDVSLPKSLSLDSLVSPLLDITMKEKAKPIKTKKEYLEYMNDAEVFEKEV